MALKRSQKAMMMRRVVVLLVVQICWHSVHAQNPYFNGDNDPANANAQNNVFYFDSNSDCNSAIRELNGFEATIKGADISSTRLGPTTCTIRLKSVSQYDGTVLDIEVKAMNILDCTTQVAIYDGDGANLLLMSYDCRSSTNQNIRRFLTSGDTATFIMTRQNVNSVNFDIEIKILPVRAGIDPGYENDWGTNFYFDKFSQEAIVGMIGGFYALVLLVCTLFVFMSFRSLQGKNRQWEVHQLATIKTGTTFEAPSQPSQVWSMGNAQSRGPNSQYSRSTQPYKPKPPPSEDGDSGVFYNDDAFQKRRLMNEERDKARPKYVSNNASFTEPEDDSDHFVEKVITPRVKTANHRNRRPPSYEEAISDHPSEHSSEEESEVSSSDNSIRKRPLSSEGSRSSRSRSSRSRTPSETESEEETESDDGRSSRDRGAKGRRRRPKPHKSKRRDSRDHAGPSRSNRPQQQQPPQPQQMQMMQPGAYGPYPPGQFVPVMAGPQFQPVQMVPGYPPPHYPEEHQAAPPPRGPQVQPTEPPVYSYLVRRGYTPLDARSNSPASTADSQRSGGGRLEEPELRLESGVEYMRR